MRGRSSTTSGSILRRSWGIILIAIAQTDTGRCLRYEPRRFTGYLTAITFRSGGIDARIQIPLMLHRRSLQLEKGMPTATCLKSPG